MEIFGKIRRRYKIVLKEFLKIFGKFLKIFGNVQNISEYFGNGSKQFLRSFSDLQTFQNIFQILRKCS